MTKEVKCKFFTWLCIESTIKYFIGGCEFRTKIITSIYQLDANQKKLATFCIVATSITFNMRSLTEGLLSFS